MIPFPWLVACVAFAAVGCASEPQTPRAPDSQCGGLKPFGPDCASAHHTPVATAVQEADVGTVREGKTSLALAKPRPEPMHSRAAAPPPPVRMPQPPVRHPGR